MAVKFTAGRFVSYGIVVLCKAKALKFTKQVKATSFDRDFSIVDVDLFLPHLLTKCT